MNNNEYHAHPAVSKSHLDAAAKNGNHYRAAYIDRILERKESLAFLEGSLAHSMILEPDQTAKEFIVSPEINKRTKQGKIDFEAFQQANAGKAVVSQDMWDNCQAIRNAVFEHEEASQWLSNGEPEQSIFFDIDGIACKCRPDWLRNDDVVVDLKTTADASPEGFAKSVANFRYHVQDWFYSVGTSATRFIFVVVEKTAPYHVAVYELDDEAVQVGKRLAMRDLRIIDNGKTNGFWYGYEGIKTISLPNWAKNI